MLPGKHRAVKDLEEFDCSYVADVVKVRDQLWQQVLHVKGGWAVVLVCYKEFAHRKWSDPLYRLVRLKKLNGIWWVMYQFNLKLPHMQTLRALLNEKDL